MPNEIDALIAEVSAGKRTEKGPYKPSKGEEAIFAGPEKGLLDYLVPLLPFYRQFTGQVPWQDPETAMEAIGWASGGLMRGQGMVKAAVPKGAASLRQALSEIGSELFGKGGVPATIEKGPLPAAIERGFTHRAGETINAASKRGHIPKELGTTESKQLPQYAGPTAPAILQPPAPQTWRERTFPGSINRAQDAIEDLLGARLRAKGMEPVIPKVPGLKYHGIQKVPGLPDSHVFTDLKTGSTFNTTDLSPKSLIAEQIRMQAKPGWTELKEPLGERLTQEEINQLFRRNR